MNNIQPCRLNEPRFGYVTCLVPSLANFANFVALMVPLAVMTVCCKPNCLCRGTDAVLPYLSVNIRLGLFSGSCHDG